VRRSAGEWKVVAVGVAFLLAGCGGGSSTNSNESKINKARAAEGSAAQIHAKLASALQLHSYAGVTDAYTIPPGGPDVYAGQSGKECDIDLIEAGSAAVQTYAADPNVLVSPDKNAVVKVGTFQGTPTSDCLQAAKNALGW
jgi:hypothetical protein